MYSPETVEAQKTGLFENIRDFASNAAERLSNIPGRKIATYGSVAVVAVFGAKEIASATQAEARNPVDPGDDVAMIGAVTVKETVGRPDGGKDTTVEVSRVKYDPFPDDDDDAPSGIYTAMNGSKEASTTEYRANKYNPLDIKFKFADAYGCGVEKKASVSFLYKLKTKVYKIGQMKKRFGKRSFRTKMNFETNTSTGDEARDDQIIDQDPHNIPFYKNKQLKSLKNRPNRNSTREIPVKLDPCYSLADATNPKYDKHKAAGYQYVPYNFSFESNSKISNNKKGNNYAALEIDTRFMLVDVRAYNPDAYASAK